MFFSGFPGGFGGGFGGDSDDDGHSHFHGRQTSSKTVDNSKFYNDLEIEKTASTADIKKAYRKLAIKHHPDKGGDGEKFKEISRAYEVLSDPEKRKIYDQHGEEGLDGSSGMTGGHASDIFDMFFGGGGSRRGEERKRRTKDTVHQIEVPLDQFYNGAVRKMAITREVINTEKGVSTCSECRGRGMILRTIRMGPMIQQVQQACAACRGEGKSCSFNKVKEILEVKIEKGMRDGEKVVFKEKSDEQPDHETGDVVIVLQEKPHSEFKRKGADLYIQREISLLEALTGFTILVTHLDGRKILVKSKPGEVIRPLNNLQHNGEGDKSSVQSTYLHAVRGEGMPSHFNPTLKGNLFVMMNIKFPPSNSITEEHAKILNQILPHSPNSIPIEEVSKHNDCEIHYVEDIDPEMSQQKAKTTHAYDEDEEDDGDRRRQHGQQVQCAQQ